MDSVNNDFQEHMISSTQESWYTEHNWVVLTTYMVWQELDLLILFKKLS